MFITKTFALALAVCVNPGTAEEACTGFRIHHFATLQACREAAPVVESVIKSVRKPDVPIAVFATCRASAETRNV